MDGKEGKRSPTGRGEMERLEKYFSNLPGTGRLVIFYTCSGVLNSFGGQSSEVFSS